MAIIIVSREFTHCLEVAIAIFSRRFTQGKGSIKAAHTVLGYGLSSIKAAHTVLGCQSLCSVDNSRKV